MSSLLELSLESLATSLERQKDLTKLPDELSLLLFQMVLERNKLTPRALKLFLATDNPMTLQRIKAMRLREPPPIIREPDGGWFGGKPRY